MIKRDEETYSLTLRSVRRPTIEALYELNALRGVPIYRLVDEIVRDWVEKQAFGELTDPALQRARLQADMDEKERLYGVRWPVDADFLAALDHGLPDCAGVALGFDRLVMLATGARHIEDVLWLPVR